MDKRKTLEETYNEISRKYAGAVRARKSSITMARNKVILIEAKIANYEALREQWRQPAGRFVPENTRMWNSLTTSINRFNRELSAAKLELAKAELGIDGEQAIDAMIEKNS